ncbi:hypothetical protein QOT17_015000 [Balamuthia mandrillaris]
MRRWTKDWGLLATVYAACFLFLLVWLSHDPIGPELHLLEQTLDELARGLEHHKQDAERDKKLLLLDHADMWPSRADYPAFPLRSFYAERRFDRHLLVVTGFEESGPKWLASTILPKAAREGRVRYLPQKQPGHEDKWLPLGAATQALWSSGPSASIQPSKAHFSQLLQEEFNNDHNLLLLSVDRPTPMQDEFHYPDFSHDFFSTMAGANVGLKLIVLIRDPVESALLNYHMNKPYVRAGGKPDIVRAARSVEKYMSLVNQQLQTLHPDDYLLLRFESFREKPELVARKICEYVDVLSSSCALLLSEALQEANKEPEGEEGEATEEMMAFLHDFFDEQRSWKWHFMRLHSKS